MTYYLGIDPGKSGGWAMISQLGRTCQTMKSGTCNTKELHTFLCDWKPTFAILEFVSSSPQQGVKSAFTFGQSYGAIEAILVCCGVPFDRVTPKKWQQAMGCLSRGDKNVTKRRAQELFPDIKVTHDIADALLLAEYCRRIRTVQGEARSGLSPGSMSAPAAGEP